MKMMGLKDSVSAKLLMASLAVSIALSGCTKPRDTKIADETVEAELMAISELQGDGYKLKLSADAQSMDFSGKPVAVNEKPSFAVREVSVPGKIAGLLKGAPVQGKAGQQVALKFKVESTNVFVMKRVDDLNDVSLLERDLIETIKGAKYLPIYAIPVKAVGVLVRQKNDYGEETYKQELRETDLSQATHVRLDLRKEKFVAVEIPRNDPKKRREIFVASQLENRISTVSELESLLQSNLGLPNASEQVVTRLLPSPGKASVSILVYSIRKKSDIKDPKLLSKLNSNIETNTEIIHCPAEVKAAVGQEDCILVNERLLEATSVQAKLDLDQYGKPTNNVSFDEVDSAKRVTLLRIGQNTPAQEVGPEVLRRQNTSNTIRVADIKDKEFLFRRTFEDAASSLSAFGPGASGNMEIVKFDLEDDRIVVRRADPINGERKAGEIDKEELMSIPVRYLKYNKKNGIVVNQPIAATRFDAEIISLDWTNNTLPTISSPLAFFDAGQCFLATGNQTIDGVDMRLDSGVLNFSIAGTYTFRPECMSYFGLNDYWYGANMQSNFNLRERLSFRVYDKSHDQMVNQDLPFRAQTLLGFGIFTMGQRVPDRFGNFNRIGNERAMPVIQDFTNGKVLTYVLGGLPSDETYRQIFIDTTKQVIADWNETLHRAFKGTPLDREGDYIDLKIDGVDVPAGHLGDLDRNYIWNFDKNLDSGLLGMSQSAPNPRTGIAEANNVLMYSGNLLSYIGSEKQAAQIMREYEKLKAAAEKKIAEEAAQEAEAERAAQQGINKSTQKQVGEAQKLIRKISDLAHERVVPMTPARLKTAQGGKLLADAIKSIHTRGEDLSERKAMALNAISTEKAYLRRIVEKALQMKATKDEAMLQALSAAEILKAYGPRLSQEERQALALQSRRLALRAEFEKNFRNGRPGCVLSAEGIPSLTNGSLADEPVEKIFSNWYAKTLSHEIGHSLGLTHNFKGSIDKANFAYGNDAKDKEREYSSIMDYFPGDHINYQKPGPYDAHALRAGYTGLIEVSDQVKAAIEKKGGKVQLKNPEGQVRTLELVAGNLIKLDTLKDLVIPATANSEGKLEKSWWNFNGEMLAKIPVKYFHFCTDIHVGGDPTCNRWDHGTTAQEIAQFYIKEYNDLYPVLNSRGNRINAVGMGSYLGRVMMDFMAVRSFLDETFYRAVQGYPDVGEFVPAALESYKFFLNVFNTPHATADVMDGSRFVRVDYKKNVPKKDAKGEPVLDEAGDPVLEQVPAYAVVEAKATKDLIEPGFDDSVRTRGIEFDKALALMMLTQRELGNPRYESIGLRLSFGEFEKFVLQMTPENSLIMRSLRSTLADNMTSVLFVDGGIARAPINVAPETSELMRYFTIMSSAVFLEADTLEDKDNFASLFRVGSSLNAPPKDRLVITKSDQDPKSRGALKFWAFDNADMASSLIRDAAQKRTIIEKSDVMANAITKVVLAENADDQKKALAEAVQTLESLNKNGVLLSEDEKKEGLTFELQIKFVINHMQQMMSLVAGLSEQVKKQGIPDEMLPMVAAQILGPIQQANQANAKNIPLLLVAGKVMQKQAEKVPAMKALVDLIVVKEDALKTNLGVITNNVQTLNKIVSILNPELNK
jgi:hypothetical protein